ncbi:acyl-CoA thioesterase-1 [Pontibacter aydingkolensis]|uniref:Arylesterase n=1 Tax=Pontibacter aydingkolensis TaxID=1911536 RepID=A0ABS7CYZ2_9BACT|nr:arylesterase [Pontibacter aydingkolensis]MBW7469071.1 arylesterase [Pontibacter aydingkolensis]
MILKRNFFIILLAFVFSFAACSEADRSTAITEERETDTVAEAEAKNEKSERTRNILFFGNSLTAGYGLEPDQAFPALIQHKIDSLYLPYKVVNAGVSGETSAGGKSRINWLLKQPIDVFVLELGANDGLRGIDPSETYKNLQTIIQKVREKNPEAQIILAGMQIPPSMGQKYTNEFRNVFINLAEEENVALIPFLLEGVAGMPKLNQADGIHPTVEGQKILAENVWAVMEDMLKVPAVQ